MYFFLFRFCVQYAFLPFINKQLQELRLLWNSHSIRHQRNGNSVPGIPDVLHSESRLLHGNYVTDLTLSKMN